MKTFRIITLLLALAAAIGSSVKADEVVKLSGTVVDKQGNPIADAEVSNTLARTVPKAEVHLLDGFLHEVKRNSLVSFVYLDQIVFAVLLPLWLHPLLVALKFCPIRLNLVLRGQNLCRRYRLLECRYR